MKHNRSWTDSLDPSILHNFPQVQVDNFFLLQDCSILQTLYLLKFRWASSAEELWQSSNPRLLFTPQIS